MPTLAESSFRPRAPAWARSLMAENLKENRLVDAAFAAGAALAALDATVRRNDPWAGVWRRRLALKSAAAHLVGRREDEAALRDAWAFSRTGGDPGPAGRVHAAWRALTEPDALRRLSEIAAGLGVARRDVAQLSEIAAAHGRAPTPAPLAAAAAAAAATNAGAGSGLACALADLVLAARLNWPAALPLLGPELLGGAGAPKPGDPAWSAACCAGYARAAAAACERNAELAGAAARLLAAAPKLRAKGAAAAVAALLDEDALTGAVEVPGLSERGLRRLFDRLVALGVVRELSGRPTFRLYGL